MEQNTDTTRRPLRIPPMVWFLGIGLVIALAAIFIFNVALSTVANYGLLAFVIGGHFFMHGSHGGHGNASTHQHGPASNAVESDKPDAKQNSGHSGGCH